MKRITFYLTIGLLALMAQVSHAQTVGVQAIGLSAWNSADVSKLSDDFLRQSGNMEVTFLPYFFNSGNPYGNANDFAIRTLPRLSGSVRLTGYMWFHDQRFNNRKFPWDAFTATRFTPEQQSFRAAYAGYVAGFDAWAKSLRAWAAGNHCANKLNFTLCPFLEDDCPDINSYTKLLNFVQQQQQRDGISTSIRRSGDPSRFRPAVPHELHGRYTDVSRLLRNGDVFSNDGNFVWLDRTALPTSQEGPGSFSAYGTPTAFSDFIGARNVALRGGVSVLLWRPGYNGRGVGRESSPPQAYVPLTGPNAINENAAVSLMLRR